MILKLHPDAVEEFEDAARYYARCQEGLELRFISCVEEAFRRVIEDPLRGRIFDGETRRWLVRVFPYALLYSVEEDHVLLLAVMHCHREPGYWHGRRGLR